MSCLNIKAAVGVFTGTFLRGLFSLEVIQAVLIISPLNKVHIIIGLFQFGGDINVEESVRAFIPVGLYQLKRGVA
jgi:hypothetical protein